MSDSIRQAWSGIGNEQLLSLLRDGEHDVPHDFVGFLLEDRRIGWLAPAHVDPLLEHLPGCRRQAGSVVWSAGPLSPAERSKQLAQAAQSLREARWIRGWRDELYSYWGEIDTWPDPTLPAYFALERAAFRFFGLRSHAVHINGFTPQGRVWCGVRAMSKATDPGRIDNLAAGGLPAGEAVLACAVRELYEEAGLDAAWAQQVQAAGRALTRRPEPEGWHDEALLVYNLLLPADVQPRNMDAEVSEFLCLSPEQAMACSAQMTEDAAAVLAQGVLWLRQHL